MALEGDDLAGVVDLFGALTRAELADALAELAFKRGAEADGHDADDRSERIAAAVRAYRLVAFERVEGSPAAIKRGDLADDTLLAPGPTAFPALPDGAGDLPHILDVPERDPDRAALGRVAEERFRADAARAVAADDTARMRELLDVSYDVEVWAPVELRSARERLDSALGDESGTEAISFDEPPEQPGEDG